MPWVFKIGKASTADCMYFSGARDDAEHTFYVCEKWEEQRRALDGQQIPDNFNKTMLQGQQEWTTWTTYTKIVLRLKKTDMENENV